MPGSTTAARRYAEAVFELGEESRALEQWQEELQILAEVAGDQGVVAVLESVKSPLEDRLALVDRALAGMSPLTRNFARLLVSRGRFGLLPQIAVVYEEMLDARN